MQAVARITVVLLLLGVNGAMSSPSARISMCDCGPPSQTEKYIRAAYGQAAAVFVGRAVQISFPKRKKLRECLAETPDSRSNYCYGIRTRIRVSKAWKGVESRIITLRGTGSNCDYQFEVGREYIVYASPLQTVEGVNATFCGLTRPLGRARLDLEIFGPPNLDWSDDA